MLSFNPILVWFYHTYIETTAVASRMLSIPFWSDFIILETVREMEEIGIFQSHFGLILSEKIEKRGKAKLDSFNPILVWFYQTSERAWFPRQIRLSIPFWSDFILLPRGTSGMSLWNGFQSHFGLILSCRPRWSHWTHQRKLSIPFWSDFIIQAKDL